MGFEDTVYFIGTLLDSRGRISGYKFYFSAVDEVRAYSPLTGLAILSRIQKLHIPANAVGVTYRVFTDINAVYDSVVGKIGCGYDSHVIDANNQTLMILGQYTNKLYSLDKYDVVLSDKDKKQQVTKAEIANLLNNNYTCIGPVHTYFTSNGDLEISSHIMHIQEDMPFDSEDVKDKKLSDFNIRLVKNCLIACTYTSIDMDDSDYPKYYSNNIPKMQGYMMPTLPTFYDVDANVVFRGKVTGLAFEGLKDSNVEKVRLFDYPQRYGHRISVDDDTKKGICTGGGLIVAVYKYKGIPLFAAFMESRYEWFVGVNRPLQYINLFSDEVNRRGIPVESLVNPKYGYAVYELN